MSTRSRTVAPGDVVLFRQAAIRPHRHAAPKGIRRSGCARRGHRVFLAPGLRSNLVARSHFIDGLDRAKSLQRLRRQARVIRARSQPLSRSHHARPAASAGGDTRAAGRSAPFLRRDHRSLGQGSPAQGLLSGEFGARCRASRRRLSRRDRRRNSARSRPFSAAACVRPRPTGRRPQASMPQMPRASCSPRCWASACWLGPARPVRCLRASRGPLSRCSIGRSAQGSGGDDRSTNQISQRRDFVDAENV